MAFFPTTVKRHTEPDPKWFDKPENEAHDDIAGVVEVLIKRDTVRRAHDRAHAAMYGDTPLLGIGTSTATAGILPTMMMPSMSGQSDMSPLRYKLNAVRQCVDTVTAKVSNNQPAAQFTTQGGDWALQKRAEGLTKFIAGIFYQTKMYELGPAIARDAEVSGTGILHPYIEDEEIKIERVFREELLVDEREARYGEPRSLYRWKLYDREVACALWPDAEEAIREAPTVTGEAFGVFTDNAGTVCDSILVIEAWHLRSSKGAEDGRHCITIQGATLLDEMWTYDYFPFVKLQWAPPLKGYWADGLVKQLAPLQWNINKNLQAAQRCLDLMAVPTICIEAGSKVSKQAITNDIGRILTYVGQKPIFEMPPSIPPELMNQIQWDYEKCFQVARLSQLSAHGEKPAGLNSAVAQRTYLDNENDNFGPYMRAYEAMFLEVARQVVDLGRELAKKTRGFSVKYNGGKFLKTIRWADVNLADDEYILQIAPVNALSKSFAARKQEVTELVQAGFYQPAQAKRLLAYPDLDRENSIETAPYDMVERAIESMLDDGVYESPEPFMDLNLALGLAQNAYCLARTQNAPEDRLALLRQYLVAVKAMIDQAAPPPQMGPQGNPMGDLSQLPPGAPGGPPPVPAIAA